MNKKWLASLKSLPELPVWQYSRQPVDLSAFKRLQTFSLHPPGALSLTSCSLNLPVQKKQASKGTVKLHIVAPDLQPSCQSWRYQSPLLALLLLLFYSLNTLLDA